MSSLSAQLAQNVSLNAAVLVDRSRRKTSASYLFTGREADQHDIEAIHALGVNSLLHLSAINPVLENYEDDLFLDRAKDTDRTLLPADQIAELDRNIEEFLWLLSPFLLEPAAGKVVEWLVRRFRINEFNVEAVLALFLPYHESPHFAKMVTILNIKPNSKWSFLIPYKSAAQSLPRVSLVTEMLKNDDVARFVTSLLPLGTKKGLNHRVLIAFNAATLHDFIKRSKSINEGTVSYLLPALLEPLQPKSKTLTADSVLGSYILLASLSQKCQFSSEALKVIVAAMASCALVVRSDQFVSSLIAVCEPQPDIEDYTRTTFKKIVGLPDFHAAVASGSTYAGSEKVLTPLAKGLTQRLGDTSLLESIIATSTTPISTVTTLTVHLLTIAVNVETEGQAQLTSRRLLSLIQQRYPAVLSSCVDATIEANESLKEEVEQLVISLSVAGRTTEGKASQRNGDIVLATSSADEKVRTMAVKELLKSIEGKSVSAIEDIETIRGIFAARLQDTSSAVLEAMYSDPATVTPIWKTNVDEYLSGLAFITSPQAKPKRNILRLHLTYLLTFFWPTVDQEVQENIFHRILFPFLLFSKPRQKTAELVWGLISTHLLSGTVTKNGSDWLSGCNDCIKSSEDLSSIDVMNQINYNVAEKIADNITSSDNIVTYQNSVLEKLIDGNHNVQLLAYLVALYLVKKLSGEHRINFAHKLLATMGNVQLTHIDDMSQEHLLLGSIGDVSLGKHIVTKPTSKAALNWVQVSIAVAISQISRPADITLDWISDVSSPQECNSRYVSLMRSVYQLANVSAAKLPVVATTLLQILFMTLKDDALAFLAGMWSIVGKPDFEESKDISFLHAAAFLEAHIQEEDGVDFQTILPSLLVALQLSESQAPQGVLECMSRIHILANATLSSVYRFDTIYGQNGRTLQYLDQDDLKRYLSALVEHRDHFANDPAYIKVFHQEHLGRTKTDKKRDSDYKHRVVCFLLSHVNAVPSETMQVALMDTIDTITDKSKLQILLPTYEALVANKSNVSENLATRFMSTFDSAAATYLNEAEPAWDIFIRVIHKYLHSGSPLQTQQTLARSIENGLFACLNQKRKIVLCEVLLEVGSQDGSALSLARSLLSAILVDVPLIIHLLEALAPAGPTTSPRAKRMKTTESSDDTLPRLSVLVEILGSKSLPGSLDLIVHLLETLSKVVQSLPATQADVSYIEQLLMSAIESTASKINEVPNLSPSVIRLDILVEVIRVSSNPQTFHQALLLIANLARLAPESVLYNVMPVFTFMGSNVFHRDDSYSFKVVQETIDGIVPVMVSSLKEVHTQPLDLYLASKEFLRVFTDAANHIPRHRRNNFFAHLVNVLGSRDFSAPVCMLLLEKAANRITRQTTEEIQASLSLPISVFQHNSPELQIYSATEILNEARRIIEHILDPTSSQPIFLEGIADGDHTASSATILRRRAQALVIFVGYAFRPKGSSVTAPDAAISVSSVISQLIVIATTQDGAPAEAKLNDIADAARSSLNKLLASLSVTDYIDAVQTMLESSDNKVQEGALDLLAKRLPDVSTNMRPQISTSVIKIIASIKNILSSRKIGHAAVNSLLALKSITVTMCPGEESALTDLVPHILSCAKESSTVAAALAVLAPICVKLGPRIIPFFRAIISQSVTVLRGTDPALFENAFAVLQGLLVTIPTFWGSSEVTQIVFLYIEQASSTTKQSSSALSTLAKNLAKRAPSTVLLPTLLEVWQGLQSSRNMRKIAAYFDVFSRALQQADRAIVLEHLRSSFKIFLEALDHVDDEARSRVILAFKELTVKLNEAAFKPLFRRLYDWAFVEKTDDNARKVTFCHLYIGLLDFFKGLMVPYMSFLLQPLSDLLMSFKISKSVEFDLWSTTIQTVTRTLNFDDSGFWRDDKIRQIAVPLTAQIEVCVKHNFVDEKTLLQDCFNALVENAIDDTLLKSINLNILMHTRSEDARVRILALASNEALWRNHGGKLLGFVAETATFIAECGEDENDVVVKESFRLKDAVETIAGKIDEL